MNNQQKNNYSIIICLYNAENMVRGLFKSLNNQENIAKSEFEIIIIDDGSIDNTAKEITKNKHLLKNYKKIVVVHNQHNIGLAKSRLKATLKAKSKYILFVDAHTRPNENYFYKMTSYNHSTVIGNVIINKNRSIWDRFYASIREKIYYPYFNTKFNDFILTSDQYANFKLKGGGGALKTRREYFIKVSKLFKLHKNINDDSKIIFELSKIEPILKSYGAKIIYLNRKGVRNNFKHLLNRGPKFVDYYFRVNNRYFVFIIMLILFIICNIYLLFLFALSPHIHMLIAHIFNLEFISLIIVNIVLSFYISNNIYDIIISIFLLPISLIAFSLGILKGIVIKTRNLFYV